MNEVNKAAMSVRENNPMWAGPPVGVGPTRSFYLLSNEVIRGSAADGFYRIERPLIGTPCVVDGNKFLEFDGFMCANRPFRVNT